MPRSSAPGEARLALTAGISCYLIWGLVPLVFQLLGHRGVSPWEILAHRTIWAVPAALLFVLLARQGAQALAVMRDPRTLGWLALTAALVAINWSTFIWAVNRGRLLETSLGYYILPLLNMAAGALIFRERLSRLGMAAVALAAIGVVIQTIALGHLPVISLLLAVSFCVYGVARKKVAADAQTGLFIECVVLAVPGIAFVAWLAHHGQSHFGQPAPSAWLIAAGPITALPLMLFSWAARRMPLSGLAFLQFLVPTMTFMLGVAEGEPFTPLRAVSFVFIWGGAGVFLWGIVRAWRAGRAIAASAALSAEETAA